MVELDYTAVSDDKKEKPDKKKAWDISTPEELVAKGYHPVVAGLTATGQQLSSPLWKYGNMFLGGLPNKALNAMGYEAPESKIKAGPVDITGVANMAANIGGFVRGVPMQLSKAGATALVPKAAVGSSLGTKIGLDGLRGGIELGGATGLTTPAEEAFRDWRSRGMRTAVGGALGGVAGGIGGAIEHFTNLLKDPTQLKTGEQVRKGFGEFKNKLTTWYAKKLELFQSVKPNKRIDLTKELDEFEKSIGDKKLFKSIFNSSPKLRKAIKNINSLTLKETQDMINQVKESLSENALSGLKVKPSQGEVKAFINGLQKAKRAAFPGMRAVDRVYEMMSEYSKAVRSYMQYGRTASGLKSMINNVEKKKALQTILTPDVYNRVFQTVKAGKLTNEAMKIINYVVRYAILYKIVKDATKNIGFGGGGNDISSDDEQ